MLKIGVRGIIGTSIAILIGIVALIVGVDRASSLIVSLLVEVIVLQLDFSDRLRKEYEELVVGLNLSRAINRNLEFVELLESLVQHLGGILDNGYELFSRQAQERLVDFVDEIRNMHGGVMHISDSQEIQLNGVWLLDHLQKVLFATSLISMEDFWFKNKGRDYHRKNMEAVKRGCAITRVFILDSPTALNDPRFRTTLSEQKEAGVDVRYVLTSDLPREAVVDFGIWDN